MGCGSSKAVTVSNAPVVAPTKGPQKVVVGPTEPATVVMKEPAIPAITPAKEPVAVRKSSPGDSGLEDAGMITEDTAGGEEIADTNRPSTPELVISGSKPAVRATREPDSDLDLDDPLLRDMSASSVRSAPVILERPSSRGGSAFDISFEEEQQNATPGLPRRLKRLEERNSSGKKKREELTLEELQAKLLAAEVRRKDYEQRLREKMQTETKKVEQYSKSANTSLNESLEKAQTETDEKEKHAVENREAHLKQLREKLKAKEERARQVREKKRLLQAQGGQPVAAQ